MQRLANKPFHDQAFQAVFGSTAKPTDDDCSTSAGSSDRGLSPSDTSVSPCYIGQELGFHASPKVSTPTARKPRPKKTKEQEVWVAPPPGLVAPPGLTPPPGLIHPSIPPPPGLEDVWEALESLYSQALAPPPGLVQEYTPKTFRKELTAILRELASNRNVAAAVRRVRTQNVPQSRQAAEFTDLLTRASEEHRGIARRLTYAFAAGLAAGSGSAFNHSECISGLRTFFSEVYEDLKEEVPRLPIMVRAELVPVLRSVLPDELLNEALPKELQTIMVKQN